jgi:5-methyltetrahydrofolate--homocysteine methyltransferase
MSRETLEKLAQAVLDGVSEEEAVALAKAALEQGLDPLECVTDGLTKGIQEVGRLFASGEYFLPQLIVGADAMMAAMKIFEPELVGDQRREVAGTVVIGTVEGDLHEIGKGLVSTMLRGNGFRVIDVGVDKTAAEFV